MRIRASSIRKVELFDSYITGFLIPRSVSTMNHKIKRVVEGRKKGERPCSVRNHRKTRNIYRKMLFNFLDASVIHLSNVVNWPCLVNTKINKIKLTFIHIKNVKNWKEMKITLDMTSFGEQSKKIQTRFNKIQLRSTSRQNFTNIRM